MPNSLYQRLRLTQMLQPIALLILYLVEPIPISDQYSAETLAIAAAVIITLTGLPIHTSWGRNNPQKLVFPVFWVTFIYIAVLIGLQDVQALSLLHASIWILHFVIAAIFVPTKPWRHFAFCCISIGATWAVLLLRGIHTTTSVAALLNETVILVLISIASAVLVTVLEKLSQREQQTVAELRYAEKQYRTIFEGAVDGIYQASFTGQFLAVNQSMVNILGYSSASELLSEQYSIESDLYAVPDERQINLELLSRDGKIAQQLIRAKRKDGSLVWLSINVQLTKDPQGEKIITGQVRDVTTAEEIKRQVHEQQIALQQSEQRNRTLINTIPDIMIWFSPDGYYQEVILRDWFKPSGKVPPNEVVGKHLSEVLPSEGAELIMKNLRLAVETGETQTYRWGPSATGQYAEARATLSANGNVLVTSRDITQEIKAELNLLSRDAILSSVGFSTEQLLRTASWQEVIEPVLERLGEATDLSRTYLFEAHIDDNNIPVVSHRYEWVAPDVKLATNRIFMRNERQDGIGKLWFELLRIGRTVQIETQHLPAGEVRDLLTSQLVKVQLLVPIMVNDSWWGFIGFDNCVEARAWSNQELDALRIAAANLGAAIEREQALNALVEVQKSESIGILAGGIAHDFNNLLTSVLGQTSLAEFKLEEGHRARKHITRAVKSAKQAANLTQQLLAYAGKGQVAIAPIDLNALVSDNIELLTTVLPATVTVEFSFGAENSVIVADRVHMQQLVMNLVINAGDAMSEHGGHLTIETHNEWLNESLIDNRFRGNQTLDEGAYFVLTVMDTGVGMDESTLANIFDPYFTTKSSGHGLGLSATLGIVNTLGGSLQVTSSVGVGTTFSVWLPVHADETVSAESLLPAEFVVG